jgi:hypothetical protein
MLKVVEKPVRFACHAINCIRAAGPLAFQAARSSSGGCCRCQVLRSVWTAVNATSVAPFVYVQL